MQAERVKLAGRGPELFTQFTKDTSRESRAGRGAGGQTADKQGERKTKDKKLIT